MKKLIITADDFGMSRIFNKEIILLCEQGKISAVSVMMKRGIEQQHEDVDSLKKACEHKNISIGLHLDFKENGDPIALIDEQLNLFKNIFLSAPDHIDIHKEIANEESEKHIVKLADDLQIPLRNRGGLLSVKHTDEERYIGSRQSTPQVEERLSSLEENKSYEIVFHPGKYDPESDSTLNKQREDDVIMIHHIHMLFERLDISVISPKDL